MYERVIIIKDGKSTVIEVLLRKLLASLSKPEVIIFYSCGVELLREKSEIITILQALEISGVDLIACGICQDGGCPNKPLLAGRITSMDEIVSVLMKAKTVISL